VVGALAVWGPPLALGYLGIEAGRLHADPGRPGGRVLRTGDRARQRRDGSLELLGRLDSVATVGGRRVDLAEVERAVRGCPGVADAAVAAPAAEGDGAGLVAWWTAGPDAEVDDIALRRHLRRLLPRHMVPQELVELERIPRRGGGAFDRAALPARQRGDHGRASPPRTPEESLVARLWCSALGLQEVSIQDNFFELGGHSLLCLQMVEQIAKRTGRRIPPTALLQDTLETVAARLGTSPAPA
jgi:acyl carrier protein